MSQWGRPPHSSSGSRTIFSWPVCCGTPTFPIFDWCALVLEFLWSPVSGDERRPIFPINGHFWGVILRIQPISPFTTTIVIAILTEFGQLATKLRRTCLLRHSIAHTLRRPEAVRYVTFIGSISICLPMRCSRACTASGVLLCSHAVRKLLRLKISLVAKQTLLGYWSIACCVSSMN